ncbi:uncharacterized protein LOC133191368 [Saccostrea echinata]|uniref:uncharacterized protein LOC133191368 n=1 Tax=Saccostrea echinata TaxID=191078 RepID=UPI002A80427F|nr:uncharacterized protein LOC133191368 [Saccostrea echinata]XP_061183107.1 uncharacterized protein LOC133191368 [Saccostrea echinata]
MYNNGSSHVTLTPESVRDTSVDDVLVFVLVFVSALVLIFIVCSAYKIREWYRTRNGDTGIPVDLPEHADNPPPYPGKLSRTNINYLPSYNSAVQMPVISAVTGESTECPVDTRTNQRLSSEGEKLTVLPLRDNASQTMIRTEESRMTSLTSPEIATQVQTNTFHPSIEISDYSSDSCSPVVFTL